MNYYDDHETAVNDDKPAVDDTDTHKCTDAAYISTHPWLIQVPVYKSTTERKESLLLPEFTRSVCAKCNVSYGFDQFIDKSGRKSKKCNKCRPYKSTKIDKVNDTIKSKKGTVMFPLINDIKGMLRIKCSDIDHDIFAMSEDDVLSGKWCNKC